jgi:isopentenyl-diphosphate delta-isomerase
MRDEDERVILVDPTDEEIGTAGKLEAHERGELHRAFSVFILNARNELLLQRRADGKYHGGGLWSNSCCGHPRPGEETAAAARRRLGEEMGIDCPLERLFSFTYRAEMAGGLTEHEIDHVFIGRYDGDPHPDPREVGAWEWVPAERVRRSLAARPEDYTPWFEAALSGLLDRSDVTETTP